jgi:hypothetical protein
VNQGLLKTMNAPQLHSQGYWMSHEEGHVDCFDPVLAQELGVLFQGKAVCDFGCGMGKYVDWLRKRGVECDGYDGNPNTGVLTNGMCHTLNLAQLVQLEKQYDGVLCLEVGEHVPKQYEAIFLDNLVRHSKELIVLSWAIPRQGGDGHVNCRSNSYVIYQLWKRGFYFQPRWTALLRSNCCLSWFRNTLMVFCKNRRPPFTLPERRAASQIIGADIERLKENNRANSSLAIALVGKGARIFLPIKVRSVKLANSLRLLRYDTTRLGRSIFGSSKSTEVPQSTDAKSPPHFFPICFTCGKHFKFVRLALFSLARFTPRVKETYVYMDKGDPLSDKEQRLLQTASPFPIIFRLTRYPMASWGPKIQLSELKAYREIAGRMGPQDYLVKLDSDVLFISDDVFGFVVKSNADAVGTPVSSLHSSEKQEEYMQGGSYFISARALRAILDISIGKTSQARTKWGEIPEDQFFSGLLRRCGINILYNDFLYFDPVFIASGTEDSELERQLRAIPATAGVLHFEGNQLDRVDRSNMSRVAERFFGPLPPLSNPYR